MRRAHPLILFGLGLSACGARAADPDVRAVDAQLAAAIDDPAPVSDQAVALADDTVVDVTAVTLAPDGTAQVRTGKTTVAAQRAAAAQARAPGSATPLIAQDPLCASASFSLWDRTDFTGNQICFAGAGTVSLADYDRRLCSTQLHFCYQVPWTLSSGSFAAGQSPGLLQEETYQQPDGAEGTIPFSPYQRATLSVAPLALGGLVLM
jgi:hypothetical protein